MKWFYRDGANVVGPVGPDEMRRLAAIGTIMPETMVRRDGMEKWSPAVRVKGFVFAVSVPPPLPVRNREVPQPIPPQHPTPMNPRPVQTTTIAQVVAPAVTQSAPVELDGGDGDDEPAPKISDVLSGYITIAKWCWVPVAFVLELFRHILRWLLFCVSLLFSALWNCWKLAFDEFTKPAPPKKSTTVSPTAAPLGTVTSRDWHQRAITVHMYGSWEDCWRQQVFYDVGAEEGCLNVDVLKACGSLWKLMVRTGAEEVKENGELVGFFMRMPRRDIEDEIDFPGLLKALEKAGCVVHHPPGRRCF